MWCFVFLAKMHLLKEVIFTVEETLQCEVVCVELPSLVLRASLHVLYHLVYSSLTRSNCEESIFVLSV